MFYREKAYTRINWKNRPNLSTPLGAKNLNKMDATINELDDRILEVSSEVEMDSLTIGFISDKVNALEEDVAENTLQINELSNLSEDVNGLKIVNTASGSTAYMDDASNMNIEDITFYGESKQETTTGKNRLPFPYYSALPYTTQGVTFTDCGNGIVNVNGTSTGDAFIDLYYNENEMLTTEPIIFSKVEGGNSTLLYFERIGGRWVQQRDVASQTTITPSVEATGQIFRITLKNGRTANNEKCYPMVRLASNADSTWEKYTGGKASPSPDYPQPIESKIVNRIDVMGKNLFDIKTLYPRNSTQGGTVTFTDDTAHISSANQKWATLRSEPFNVKKGNTYTVSFNISNYSASTETLVSVGADEITKHTVIRFTENGHFTQTFIATEDELNMLTVTSNNSSETVTNTFDISELQVEKGTVATTYEPYQSQTVNLSAPIELNGLGDARDYIDLERGVIVRKVYKKVFTGNESFHTYTPGVGGIQFAYEDANIMRIESENVLCTHLPPKFTWLVREDGIAITENYYVVRFRMESLGISTVEDLKAKLKEWYDAGNPMVLYAPIKTPIETALPIVDQTAIKQLHTYKPNTIVMNDADAEMDVHYVADPRLYIDKKFEALASAIVNQ